MASYSLIFDMRVLKKDLPPIPAKGRKKILVKIDQLSLDPYPVDSIQLTGSTVRRIRQGNYRILYQVNDSSITVYVVRVGHRSVVYR